jgi:hypothetical protein
LSKGSFVESGSSGLNAARVTRVVVFLLIRRE